MAIVGHWADLEEAQKLVQSKLLAGVVQEIYEEGQLISMLPVFAINSLSIKYNRETTPPSAAFYDIHEQIGWTADVVQKKKEVELKRVARASMLDRFMMATYKDPNDYRTIVLRQLRKGCMRTIEDKFIYGDVDNDEAEYDGIGHLFEIDAVDGDNWGATAGRDLQQRDMSGDLSVEELRTLIDTVKPRPDILLMTRTMQNMLSAAAFEKGLAATMPGSVITMKQTEFGARVPFFDGIRIVISDYMLHEDEDSGDYDSTDTAHCSIFAIRFGQIIDGGLCLCIGGQTGGPEFFNLTEIDDMEDYDASGLRLVAYCSLALGGSKSLARIHGIDESDAVVV